MGEEMKSMYRKYPITENPFSYIGNDILEMLWFLDGPLKNCGPIKKRRGIIRGYKLDYKEIAISMKMPIKMPENWEYIPPLKDVDGVCYSDLHPLHRGNYLIWLQNPLKNYMSYYYDTFFCGVRQHVIEGGNMAYKAIDMFDKYIDCFENKHYVFFNWFLNPINSAILSGDDNILKYALEKIGRKSSGGTLNAKFLMCDTLSAQEVIAAAEVLPGISIRKKYFEDNRALFADIINRILEVDYDGEFPLMEYTDGVNWREISVLRHGEIIKVNFPEFRECDNLIKEIAHIIMSAIELTNETFKRKGR